MWVATKTLRVHSTVASRAPWLIVLVWLPLFLVPGFEASWEAHDEGLYVSRARLMLETGDWVHPFGEPHHKPPGFYWVLATVFAWTGAGEWASRLPSALATLASMLLIHRIGQAVGLGRGALLAALAFATMPLVVLLGHMARPDPLLVALGLGLVLSVVKGTEPAGRHTADFAASAGFLVGLMALLRGPAAFWFAAGLIPFLVVAWRDGRRLPLGPLVLGLIVGSLPLVAWLLLALRREPELLASILGFTTSLAAESRGNGPFYYLWNVTLLGFPWSPLGVAGAVLLWRDALPGIRGPERVLLWSLPLVLLVTLSVPSTRLQHYALGIYPGLALLAGAFLEATLPAERRRGVLIALAGLGGAVLVAGLAATPEAPGPGLTGVALGGGLLGASTVALRRRAFGWPVAVLAALWLGGVAATLTSTLGNVNPDMKAFLRRPEVAAALDAQTPTLGDMGRVGVLIRAYGRSPVPEVESLSGLPDGSLVWVDPEAPVERRHEVVAEAEGAALLRLLGP
jgi:4-amino-4-deoxy-L-arabinose transferase-like glycosyltransferase